jgi:hypothetical protein
MITNDYSSEVVVTDDLALPQRDYHKVYVKESKVKHVLFALFIVAMLIAASILLNS